MICERNDYTNIGQNILNLRKGANLSQEQLAEIIGVTRPNIKLGICGEHGGEPSSVEFYHKMGLTYVSCSPFRVPIARLAAAQAALNEKENK